MKTDLHQHACLMANASECAGNKFWRMHDYLYANQKKIASLSQKKIIIFLKQKAKKMSLNKRKFEQCLIKKTGYKRIINNIKEGNKLKISGTPTIYLNGKLIQFIDQFIPELAEREAKKKLNRVVKCTN